MSRYHRIIYIGHLDECMDFINECKCFSLLKDVPILQGTPNFVIENPNCTLSSSTRPSIGYHTWASLPERFLSNTLFVRQQDWRPEGLLTIIQNMFFNSSRNNAMVEEQVFDVAWYFHEHKEVSFPSIVPIEECSRFEIMDL